MNLNTEVKVKLEEDQLDFSELAPHIRAVATGTPFTPRPRDIEQQYGGGHGPGCSKEQMKLQSESRISLATEASIRLSY